MGTSLDNYYVWSESVTIVREALTALNRIAFVSDACNGWVSVFPNHDYINQGEIAQQLSGHLNLPVISFWMYDGDVGGYRLYENGELRDEYETNPDYFAGDMDQDGSDIPLKSPEERAWLSGNPLALLPYCLGGTTTDQIRDALETV